MSGKQLPEDGIQFPRNNTNLEMQDYLTDEERRKRLALTQSQFREMISLNPEKLSKQQEHFENDKDNYIKQQTQKSKIQQHKDQDDNEEYQDVNNYQGNEKEKDQYAEGKNKLEDIQNCILTVLVLESVEIFSDIIQYVELKVKSDFINSWEDTLLGFSTIFALTGVLIIGWIYKFMIKQEQKKKKIIRFYNSFFYSNYLNKYCSILIVYLIILNILRFETYLIRIEKRLHTFLITFIIDQTILSRLNKKLSNFFVFCSTLYMSARYLIQNNDYVYIFFSSIIASLAISYRYYFQIQDQQDLDKQRTNQQFVTEYFKQFYHNIISMMPQGILIIDESEQLVYANKTTKKLLSCKSKNSIIDSLKNLIVQDPSKIQSDMNQNDDVRTIKETKTLKSFKSQKSNHIKKPFTVHNSNNNTNSNYNTNNLCASDSESFVSAYQVMDGFYASPLPHQKQVIKPVKDKQNQNLQMVQQSIHNFQQQGNSSSSKLNQNRNSVSSNKTFQQPSYPITQNQLDKNTPQTLQQSIPIQKLSSTSMNNDLVQNTGGVISKITTTIEAASTQLGQYQSRSQDRKQSFKIANKQSLQESQPQMYQIQMNSNNNSKNFEFANNNQNGPKRDSIDAKQGAQKIKKNLPFKYLQFTGMFSQKNFENLSVMNIISILLKNCIIKLRGGDLSDIQDNSDQNQGELSEFNHNFCQNYGIKKEVQQDHSQQLPNSAFKSQKSSVQRGQKDSVHKQLSQQASGSQKTFQKNPESAGSNQRNQKLSLDNYQSLSNNPSSYPQKESSFFNHKLKNNTEIAQNSLSIRVKVKEKLIEITFVQCEARLLQSLKGNQNINNSLKANTKLNTTTQNNKFYKSEKDDHFNNRLQSNTSAAAAQTSYQVNNNEPNTTAMMLVFLEDITQEVYIKRLEEINNYKVKMLNSISHELKTPLNCSMGMLDDILNFVSSQDFGNPQTAQKIRDSLEPAQQSNQLLLYMIRDIIDLGTFELLEKFKYAFSKFNLKDLLWSCVEVMRFQGELKFIEINLEYEHGLDEFIVSDENRVRQIVVNFLTNSLKFTQKNGKISIKAEIFCNNNVKISVEDNGMGIPQKKIQDLFKMYNRYESQMLRKQTTQGIGIGLSVSYRLAQGLTIDEFKYQPIQVRSEEKKGSTFSFILKNQDPSLIDETQRENDGEDEYNQYSNKMGTFFQRNRDSEVGSFNREDNNQYERSQTFTLTKTLKKQLYDQNNSQYDIPEDFDQEEEEDKENGFQEKQASSFKKSHKMQKYTAQSRDGLEGDENIQEESEFSLKLNRGDITTNIPSYQKYFQNDLTNFQSERCLDREENCESISKQQIDTIHQVHQAEVSVIETNKEHSQLNQIKDQKQTTLVKFPSLSYLSCEDSQLIKLGSHYQSGMVSQLSGAINQNNNNAQNSPAPLSPYSSFLSFVNLEMQQTIDEFIQQNLHKKTENFKSEFGQILIVDDVQFNLLMLQNMLKKYQMKVDIAHDGEEAVNKVIDKYKKMNDTYKIIFMDIQMPIMDGFQATKEIRKFLTEKNLNNIPIVAISAFADQQYREQSKKVGMTDYIEKPVQTNKIDRAFLKYIIK